LDKHCIDHNVCIVDGKHHNIPSLSLKSAIEYCQKWLRHPDTLLLVGHANFHAHLMPPKNLAHPIDVMAIESSISAYLYCEQVQRDAILCILLETTD
jgi:hypothetical protein